MRLRMTDGSAGKTLLTEALTQLEEDGTCLAGDGWID
jgi:hypothetical protein